jgi:hypothetical protein
MLNDAEKQRQLDCMACEASTKCKSIKNKGQNCYEYYEINSGQSVNPEEYEKRYMPMLIIIF